MKKPFIYAALAVASVLAGGLGSTAQAVTVKEKPNSTFIPVKVLGVDEPKQVEVFKTEFQNEKGEYLYEPREGENGLSGTIGTGENADTYNVNGIFAYLDPGLGLGFGYTDNGLPSMFGTSSKLSFAPLTGNNVSLFAQGGYTMTPLSDGAVSMTQNLPDGIIEYSLWNGDPDLGGILVKKFGLGSSVSSPPVANLSGTYTPTTMFANCSVGGCDWLKIEIKATGSGGGDSYGFSSSLEATDGDIPNTPEPSATAALVGIGLFSLTFLRRRKLS